VTAPQFARDIPIDGTLPIVMPPYAPIRSETDRLRAASVHESGHAVAAAVLGIPVGRTEIGFAKTPDGRSSVGCCHVKDWPAHMYASTEQERAAVRAMAVVNAAAVAAEERIPFDPSPQSRAIHMAECCRIVRYLRPGLSIDDIMAEMRQSFEEAGRLVDAVLPVIRALSEQLFRARQVLGSDVCRFVRDAVADDPSLRAHAEEFSRGFSRRTRVMRGPAYPGEPDLYVLVPPRAPKGAGGATSDRC
jgi:hypothetical protein